MNYSGELHSEYLEDSTHGRVARIMDSCEAHVLNTGLHSGEVQGRVCGMLGADTTRTGKEFIGRTETS
jgi:hypothetical protein